MGFLLKQIFSLVKLLHSETGSHSIASGVAFGLVLGFSPLLSLQSFLVFIFLFLFRIQVTMAFLSAFFFSFVAWLFDPLLHLLGLYLLTLPPLNSFWSHLYQMPLVPFTRFNNTIVLGSGVATLLAVPFVYYASFWLVNTYRQLIVQRIKGTKFWRVVQATSFYRWYYSYEKLYG